jgi:putative transposase
MHLARLERTWVPTPITFITTCTAARRPILASSEITAILRREWSTMQIRHGWAVGRYVVMPDHVHFFMAPSSPGCRLLSTAIGKWKEWSAREIAKLAGLHTPIWQPSYFDRVLRSEKDFFETWQYIQHNPVRGGLIANAVDWPFSGSIHFESYRVAADPRPGSE